MARYIDADALIEKWDELSVRGRTEFNQVIMMQPTAFDLDKVVQELEEHPNVFRPFGGDGYDIPLHNAIEVVKAGGIGSQWWNS